MAGLWPDRLPPTHTVHTHITFMYMQYLACRRQMGMAAGHAFVHARSLCRERQRLRRQLLKFEKFGAVSSHPRSLFPLHWPRVLPRSRVRSYLAVSRAPFLRSPGRETRYLARPSQELRLSRNSKRIFFSLHSHSIRHTWTWTWTWRMSMCHVRVVFMPCLHMPCSVRTARCA